MKPTDTPTKADSDSHNNLPNAMLAALDCFEPSHIELVNESQNHAGFYPGKQSHFKLTLVSSAFVGQRLVGRHQQVYTALKPWLVANGGTVHALALHVYTPNEWQARAQAPNSPLCAGQR